MIEHRCPECSHFLRIPDQFAGKRGKCKYCHVKFDVPAGPILPDPAPGTRGDPEARPMQPVGVPGLGPAPSVDDLEGIGAGAGAAGLDLSFEPSPDTRPRPPISSGGPGNILGAEFAGRHFSVWLVLAGGLIGLFGLPLGGQLAAAGLVYYLNFGRDVSENWLFNKFTAPVWGTFAFVTVPLGVFGALLGAVTGATYVDQLNENVYAFQYTVQAFEQLAEDPDAEVAPPAEEIPDVLPLPEGPARYPLVAVLNVLFTAASATLGVVLGWLGVGLSLLITVAVMSPFYLVKQVCEWVGETGGVVIYGLLILCSGTFVLFIWGYIALLVMFWLGRRILEQWGHNPDWGLAWRGFIYFQE